MFIELRLLLALAAMFLLPGGALLAMSSLWSRWQGLPRIGIIVGLSGAFYPVLFYTLRFWLPAVRLNASVMAMLLVLCALVMMVRLRGQWRQLLALDGLEWCAVALFAMTLFSRLWFAHLHPYPAWTDSLHHALLTRMTAEQGQLAHSLEPYFPITMDMYHLGLYAHAATLQWLAGVSSHMALVWSAQALNGLCGLGVYLTLDVLIFQNAPSQATWVRHIGALVGAATAGLFLHQPALYANWGRYTQGASQSLLLIAWVVTLHTVADWGGGIVNTSPTHSSDRTGKRIDERIDERIDVPGAFRRSNIAWGTLFSGLLTAGVFLIHFRVAAFYAPLLALGILAVLWRRRGRALAAAIAGTIAVGAMSLFFILPVLWTALNRYITLHRTPQTMLTPAQVAEIVRTYYSFTWDGFPYLIGISWWMAALVALLALVGLWRRNPLTIQSVLWMAALYGMGMLYMLNIPMLRITNLGAVLILFYLPIGLCAGAGITEIVQMVSDRWQPDWQRRASLGVAALVLTLALPAARMRINTVEPFRFFVQPGDLTAMRWINEHTPPDATFAINTYFWLANAPHGTDGGYWIPYFTGRHTTTSAMPLNAADFDYQEQIFNESHAVEALKTDPSALDTLYDMGIEYIYLGVLGGNFDPPGLDLAQLRQSPRVEVLYAQDGVAILRILPP